MISSSRASSEGILLLDAGDSLLSDERQPVSLASKGALAVDAMNLMGYDAMALGERDLELGLAFLQDRMERAEFPFLSANLLLADSGNLFALPYVILPFGDFSVGIIGLTGISSPAPADFKVLDPFETVRGLLPQVTEQVDLVILLSHLGWAKNVELANMYPEIDLIIGGGTDAPGSQPYRSNTTGTYLAQVELPSPGHVGRYVGHWQLSISADGQPQIDSWRLVSLDPQFQDDAQMLALLRRYGIQ